jgi:hypothetical protein
VSCDHPSRLKPFDFWEFTLGVVNFAALITIAIVIGATLRWHRHFGSAY